MALNAGASERIGIFGGAFDPPHRAHIELVRTAIAQLRLDALQVLPTGDAWHKTRTLSPAADRLAMARLAFAGLAAVRVDDREMRRDGPTYTVDTLRELQAQLPQAALFLIIGADQYRTLPSWHDWRSLLRIATICVAEREGGTSTSDRFDLKNPDSQLPGIPYERLLMPAVAVSSTDIRARIARGASEPEIATLVPPAVARYIATHHLYRPTA